MRGADLFVNHRYRLERATGSRAEAWAVEPIGYRYDILDHEGRELLTYHWHPLDRGPDFPHLHVSGRIGALPVGDDASPVALGGMHLPTGRIGFGAIVQLLVTEFGIAPRRDDWERIVAATW